MPSIKIVGRNAVPPKVVKGPTNQFDQALIELKPNEALTIEPVPGDERADDISRWIGSIKMQLSNARKRTDVDAEYWDDGSAVYVALANNVPTNGHSSAN